MLAWTGANGKLVLRSSNDTNGSIHLQDHRGVSSKIKYKHHDKPNVGLGFSLTPLGEQSFEFEKRLDQARACATAIATARMSVTETWLAFVTRVLPKVTYPFMLTRFTKKQLHRISVILDNVVLPKMGVNRKMARAVVYGPLDLGGIG